jgi:hypothetical protein
MMTKLARDASLLQYNPVARDSANSGETIPMRILARILTISGVAAMAMSLGAAQPARAGDGADLGSLQTLIDDVCAAFSMSTCPMIPTITQAVLQLSAMIDVVPDVVRSSTAVAVPFGRPYVDALNPSHPPGIACTTGCVDPLNPIAGLPVDPAVLSTLRPLAFISAQNGKGPATPTQLYDPSADTFLYAVGGLSAANGGSSQPDTLILFYDDPNRTNSNVPQGQVIAKLSLPLTVLNKDGVTERAVPASLQFKNPGTGGAPCSVSTITGDFAGNGTQQILTNPFQQIGVNCAVVFAASPVSPHPHAIFEVTIPMLITPNNDPAIINGSSFSAPFFGDFGFQPASGVLGTTGQSIGVGPNAAPAPVSPCTPGPSGCTYALIPSPSFGTYALCANLPHQGNGSPPVPSVAAFYAIGGDGEVKLSAPLAPQIPYVCPTGF